MYSSPRELLWSGGGAGETCTIAFHQCLASQAPHKIPTCRVHGLQSFSHFRNLGMALLSWADTHRHPFNEGLDITWSLNLHHHWKKHYAQITYNTLRLGTLSLFHIFDTVITDCHPKYSSLCSSILLSESQLHFLWFFFFFPPFCWFFPLQSFLSSPSGKLS